MKRNLVSLITVSVFSIGFLTAKTSSKNAAQASTRNKEALVTIDSLQIIQKSKEGQKVTEKINKKVADYQAFVKKSQEELTTLQSEIAKKSEVLSRDALQEKTDELGRKKKQFERKIADREELLRLEIKREQVKLRDKHMTVANKIFEEKKWEMMVDKNTPGVLFVSKSIDVTDQVLKRVDDEFEDSLSKKSNVEDKKEKKELKRA